MEKKNEKRGMRGNVVVLSLLKTTHRLAKLNVLIWVQIIIVII